MPLEQSSLEKRKKQRQFILGVLVLLIVDLLWVGSAELSSYIFKEIHYNKPFFTTYFKTSTFVLFLLGFAFIRSWRYQCTQLRTGKNTKALLKEVNRISTGPLDRPKITSGIGSSNISGETSAASTPLGCITPPKFESMTDEDEEMDDDNEVFDDLDLECSSRQRKRTVSFSNVREVRSFADKYSDAQVLSRMSHQSIEELKDVLLQLSDNVPMIDTLKLAACFTILWLFATLFYQEALALTSPAVTNILSSTSGIFTLILAALFPSSSGDRFNFTKLLTVLISFGGIVLVILTDPSNKHKKTSVNIGDFMALAGAILYASYLILIRRKVGTDRKLDMFMFFGFVGVFGIVLLWPGFFILHYTGVEKFELPPNNKTWYFLVANAIIGTVISELLWLWGCFLTSSLMATLSLGLVVPLTMAFDMVVNNLAFSSLFIVGVIPILVGFAVIGILTHYEGLDPVKNGFLKLCDICCKRGKHFIETEEESLLSNSNEQIT